MLCQEFAQVLQKWLDGHVYNKISMAAHKNQECVHCVQFFIALKIDTPWPITEATYKIMF